MPTNHERVWSRIRAIRAEYPADPNPVFDPQRIATEEGLTLDDVRAVLADFHADGAVEWAAYGDDRSFTLTGAAPNRRPLPKSILRRVKPIERKAVKGKPLPRKRPNGGK